MKNKTDHNNFEEIAILNFLGLLSPAEKDSFRLMIDESSEDERDTVKTINNLSSLFAGMLLFQKKKIIPSPSVKEKLFDRINTENKKINIKKDFEFIYSEGSEWIQHPEIKGIQVKRLAVNEEKGYLMILLKAEPGAQYPPHHHYGAEECYVIEGDLFVEGEYLGPGDFHHADGGSDHGPLITKNGCTLLLVVDPKDY